MHNSLSKKKKKDGCRASPFLLPLDGKEIREEDHFMQGCTHRSCMTPSARNTTHICVSFFFYTVFADSTESYIQRGMDENNSKTKRWDSATIGERVCVHCTHTHTQKKKNRKQKRGVLEEARRKYGVPQQQKQGSHNTTEDEQEKKKKKNAEKQHARKCLKKKTEKKKKKREREEQKQQQQKKKKKPLKGTKRIGRQKKKKKKKKKP